MELIFLQAGRVPNGDGAHFCRRLAQGELREGQTLQSIWHFILDLRLYRLLHDLV